MLSRGVKHLQQSKLFQIGMRMNHCSQSSNGVVRSEGTRARITLPAPTFSGKAYVDGGFKNISLSDYSGKYLVLFFFPYCFTFVCPTEICAFNDAAK